MAEEGHFVAKADQPITKISAPTPPPLTSVYEHAPDASASAETPKVMYSPEAEKSCGQAGMSIDDESRESAAPLYSRGSEEACRRAETSLDEAELERRASRESAAPLYSRGGEEACRRAETSLDEAELERRASRESAAPLYSRGGEEACRRAGAHINDAHLQKIMDSFGLAVTAPTAPQVSAEQAAQLLPRFDGPQLIFPGQKSSS